MTGYSDLFFALDGYAVLDNAAMPVVGSDPDTVNNHLHRSDRHGRQGGHR